MGYWPLVVLKLKKSTIFCAGEAIAVVRQKKSMPHAQAMDFVGLNDFLLCEVKSWLEEILIGFFGDVAAAAGCIVDLLIDLVARIGRPQKVMAAAHHAGNSRLDTFHLFVKMQDIAHC
jgi:hypothetical protein